jgi:hypothetical protein
MAWHRMIGVRDAVNCRCHDDVARTLLVSAIARLILNGERDPKTMASQARISLTMCRND